MGEFTQKAESEFKAQVSQNLLVEENSPIYIADHLKTFTSRALSVWCWDKQSYYELTRDTKKGLLKRGEQTSPPCGSQEERRELLQQL